MHFQNNRITVHAKDDYIHFSELYCILELWTRQKKGTNE